MDAAALKAAQGPLKERYREAPEAALITLRATGSIGEGVTCSIETGHALVRAGLHPATGGAPVNACSGDMLLQALVACAGVTLMRSPRRSASRSATPGSRRKAISISAARSAFRRRRRSASARSGWPSTSTAT